MTKEELKTIRKEYIDADTAYDLLDDMDFNRYGKVVCPKIERTHPHLKRMAEEQMSMW